MLYENTKKVKGFKGSSLLSPAHGSGGARATILSLSAPPPPEKITGGFPAVVETLAGRQQAGKKKKGSGENEFLPACFPPKAEWGGSVSALPFARGRQNRKIFVSLIEKNFGGVQLKKCRENFSVLLAEVERRRAETLGGIYSKSACGFSLKKVRILFKTDSNLLFYIFS